MNSEILDRTPPHSLGAERAVLGSILIDPATLPIVADQLYAGDGPIRTSTNFSNPIEKPAACFACVADGLGKEST